jgi:hypothetical protein
MIKPAVMYNLPPGADHEAFLLAHGRAPGETRPCPG